MGVKMTVGGTEVIRWMDAGDFAHMTSGVPDDLEPDLDPEERSKCGWLKTAKEGNRLIRPGDFVAIDGSKVIPQDEGLKSGVKTEEVDDQEQEKKFVEMARDRGDLPTKEQERATIKAETEEERALFRPSKEKEAKPAADSSKAKKST
jgi:hypothetical protein